MIIVRSLSEIPSLASPLGLTIGSFDGIHLGHQYLLQTLSERLDYEGTLAVLTFGNHPTEVIKNQKPSRIISLEHQLKLLEDNQVDLVILLEFTKELSNLTYQEFLQKIKQFYPFETLVLGEGAFFGKNREGNENNVKALQDKLGFTVEYLKKFTLENQIVSSNKIRDLLSQGDLSSVFSLLGRPYSLYGKFSKDNDPQKIYLSLEGMCLVPEGKYSCKIPLPDENVSTLGTISHNPPRLTIDLPPVKIPSTPIEVILSQKLF